MAAGNETLTTLGNVLKRRYDQPKVTVMAIEDDAWLALVPKQTKFGGSDARIALRYGSPQGGSVVLGTAIANQTSSSDAAFILTRAHDYHVCSMDAEAMFAGQGSENTVLDAMDGAMEGGMRMIRRSLEIGVYGDGTGTRGKIDANATSLSTTALGLADITSVSNFEVGMKVQFANPTGPVLRSATSVTVNAVNRDTGVLTLSVTPASVSGTIAAGDLIVREGDLSGLIKGLAAWLPLTRPTSGDNFFGQDRSNDVTRMAGVTYTGGGAQKVETLVKANIRLSREGGKDAKRVGLLNIEDLGDIAIGLGAKAMYEPVKSEDGAFGFSALSIITPRGNLKLLGSINVPKGEFYILQTDTWVLKSLKGLPHVVDDDGVTMLRGTTTDSVTWRLRYWAQLGCYAPGYNLHGTF